VFLVLMLRGQSFTAMALTLQSLIFQCGGTVLQRSRAGATTRGTNNGVDSSSAHYKRYYVGIGYIDN
jgi:hypothetical protein